MSGRKANFLDFVPFRKIHGEPDADGRLVLLLPKFGQGAVGRWWASVVGEKRSVLKIHLDELGARTWNAIDGSRSIAEIADTVQQDCDEDLDQRYERCSRFLNMLTKAGAVGLHAPSDE